MYVGQKYTKNILHMYVYDTIWILIVENPLAATSHLESLVWSLDLDLSYSIADLKELFEILNSESLCRISNPISHPIRRLFW